MAAADENNPHELAISRMRAAQLQVYLREYREAEVLATRALEQSEKNRILPDAAYSRCVLGRARAELSHATDGVALIRQGIAGLLEVGLRLDIPTYTAYLAAAQWREGAIIDALKTVEQALRANPDALTHRPEMLRLRGEVRRLRASGLSTG
jgi:tetratricopeptide (TPR) repeat protein